MVDELKEIPERYKGQNVESYVDAPWWHNNSFTISAAVDGDDGCKTGN